jgi:Protein of unknown function (DUF3237)
MTRPLIRTEYAFTARVSVAAPLVIAAAPEGPRRFVPIIGGTVEGPLLSGEILGGGGDSQLIRADGVIELEASYRIRTADGVTVEVLNRGLRHGSAEVMARLAQGEQVSPTEYYSRTTPRFKAPSSSPYEWLNRAVFIASAERLADVVIVHFHQVM